MGKESARRLSDHRRLSVESLCNLTPPPAHRSSITSRVSSLTRESSNRSIDGMKMDLSELSVLVGRTKEQNLLHAAFNRLKRQGSPKAEVILIHGQAGTGKTALVTDFKDSVLASKHAYFACGRFNQYQAVAEPYSAIVEGFNGLCESIENGPEKEKIQADILKEVGYDLAVLTKLIPKLKGVADDDNVGETINVDDDSKQPANSQQQALKQLILVFRKFLRVICKPSHPLVLFLDDLQWADSASMEFIASLVSDVESTNFMFLGAYRDEPGTTTQLTCISGFQKKIDIQLSNLDLPSVTDILVDLTGISGKPIAGLASIVHRKTDGNPFSIFQFLEMLQRKDLLTFSFETHKWEWDVRLIKSKTNVTQNVGQLLADQIDDLSKDAQKVLKLAACIGFSFDYKLLETIAHHLGLLNDELHAHIGDALKRMLHQSVSDGLVHRDQMRTIMASQVELMNEQLQDKGLRDMFYEETIESIIHEAEFEGLIEATGSGSNSKYKFCHEKVHKCLYDMTPEGEERDELHYHIGKVMRSTYEAREEDELLFAAADHLNRGRSCFNDEEERINLIRMNLKAAKKAKEKSALVPAADILNKGILLIEPDNDWDARYELLIEVYSNAAELEFACGRLDKSMELSWQVHERARTLEDRLLAHFICMQVFQARRKIQKALQSGFFVLQQLGEPPFPKKSNKKTLKLEFKKTRNELVGWTEEALVSIPLMKDRTKIYSMWFLNSLALMALHAGDDSLTTMILLRMIQISLHHGLCNYTPFAYASYGMLISIMGDTNGGYKFGCLAIQLCERLGGRICIPRTYLIVYTMLYHLRHPLSECVEPLLVGYRIGTALGDIEYAGNCAAASSALGFVCSLHLPSFADDLKHFCEQLKSLGQDVTWCHTAPMWQLALNLMGKSEDPKILNGEAMTEEKLLQTGKVPEEDSNKNSSLVIFYFCRHVLAYIFGDIRTAYKTKKELAMSNSNIGMNESHFMAPMNILFSGLVTFARYKDTKRWKYRREARGTICIMEDYVDQGLVNCVGMLLLLKAENASLTRKVEVVKNHYNDAIDSFAMSGFTHLQAIANERAAEYMLKANEKYLFQNYVRKAVRLYGQWGASAKVQMLVEKYHSSVDIKREENAPSFVTIRGHGGGNSSFASLKEGSNEMEDLSMSGGFT